MHIVQLWTAFLWMLGDSAPNLEGFEDVPFLFVGLWQMFLILLIVLAVIGAFLALLAVFAPGAVSKIGRIFRL